jgi:hypothetical protein
MTLRYLPWRAFRRAHRFVRRVGFSGPKPTTASFVVETLDDAPVVGVVRSLGVRGYTPNWAFSYRYRGEDLNLADTFFAYVDGAEDIRWWQVHVRGWQIDDRRVELYPHFEAEPTEHPRAHLDGVGYNVERGVERLGRSLDVANVRVLDDPRK